MLVLTRKPGQCLKIRPLPSLDPTTTVAELFRTGPIEILVTRVEGDYVRIGVQAHPGLLIVREELEQARAREPGDRRRGPQGDES
jgi:sRNA-binding carbon storage regulator CsrA